MSVYNKKLMKKNVSELTTMDVQVIAEHTLHSRSILHFFPYNYFSG